ncbi:MAG: hypothetical protein ACYTF7_02185 [Planctomycetota bacterium]|jgi:hypothetical protein
MSRFMDNDIDSGAGDPLANPEAGGDASGGLEGIDGTSSSSSSLRSNLLLLLFVGGIAAGSMWFMRSYSNSTGVELTDVKIDYEAPKSTDQARTQELIESLSLGNKVQVPAEEIRPEPFTMPSKGGEEVETPVNTFDPGAAAKQRAESRRKAIQIAFEKLDLNSVITGSIPIARVSGQPVRIGDAVGEYFTVTEIRDRSVVLTADDEMYILALQ